MSVYSTNLNRQLYVVAGVESSLAAIQPANKKGYIYVGSDKDGCKYINQNGKGGIVRSDLIDPKSVMWVNVTAPKDTEIKLKAVTVALNSNFNSGAVIAGEDYILRVNFRQMYGMSDEDIYQKYGAVHATSAMTATPSLFYKAMIYSLFKNFSRLYAPMLEIGVNSKSKIVAKATKESNGTVHLYDATGTEINDAVTAIYIAEKSQVEEWSLGTKQYTPVYFEVIPTTVVNSTGEEGVWGTVTTLTSASDLPTPVGNGYKYADLEYFCMGERGDQYRNIGWPNSIKTEYFVDPTDTYYAIDIQYAYKGTCEDIQKSEKTITFLIPSSVSKDTIDSILEGLGVADKAKYTSAIPSVKFKKDAYTVATSGTVTVKAVKENSENGTIEYSITIPSTGGATGTTVNSSTGVVTASTTAGTAIVTATLKESTTTVDTATCEVTVG